MSTKCSWMLRFIYCRHKSKVHRINRVRFRMSSYPHRIQQFFLVYFTHRKSQCPFSWIQAANFFKNKQTKKSKNFPAPPKIISVDRPIYNRKEFQSIFPRIFIENVFHKIPTLPDITFTKQELPISKEFQISRAFAVFSHCPNHYPSSCTGFLKSKYEIDGSRNASVVCDTSSMEINLSGPRIKWFLVNVWRRGVGYAVAQMAKALRYTTERRGFDSQWVHLPSSPI